MTAASELKAKQTEEEKQMQDMLLMYTPGMTLEQLCFAAGNLDYEKVLASDLTSAKFMLALVDQAVFLRKQIVLQGEKLQHAKDVANQASIDRLDFERALERLMTRIAQVRQLQ